MKKTKIILIVIASLVALCVGGCFLAKNRYDYMMKQTIADVQILNEKSDLDGCSLLDSLPNASYHPRYLADGVSRYFYSENVAGAFISEIYIKSSEYHVFGIRVGDDLSTVNEILKNEGFTKRRVLPPSSKEYPITRFRKHYLEVYFYVDPDKDNSTITKIGISVDVPRSWKLRGP